MRYVFLAFLTLIACAKAKEVVEKRLSCNEPKGEFKEKLKEACDYLGEFQPDQARAIFGEILKRAPRDCGAVWGVMLSNAQIILVQIDKINTLITKAQSASPPLKPLYLEKLAMDYLGPIDEALEEIMQVGATAAVCELEARVPVKFRVSKTIVDLTLYGVWGEAEAYAIAGLANIVKASIDFVLAHNLNISLWDIVRNKDYIDTSDSVAIARSLGFVMELSRKFLKFSAERGERFGKVPGELSQGLDMLTKVVPALEHRRDKEEYLIIFLDGSGDGVLGYDWSKAKGNDFDRIEFKVKGYVTIDVRRYSISTFMIQIPGFVLGSTVKDAILALEKAKKAFDLNDISVEEVSISDINSFFGAFGLQPVEDILRFRPRVFFEARKPLRDYMPWWYYDNEHGNYVFAIEGEVALEYFTYAEYRRNYLQAGDSMHFLTLEDLEIPRDCIEPVGKAIIGFVIIPYIGFKDPSFSGSVLTHISEDFTGCPYDGQTKGFNPADLYSINKVIAIMVARYGGIIPILDAFLKTRIQ